MRTMRSMLPPQPRIAVATALKCVDVTVGAMTVTTSPAAIGGCGVDLVEGDLEILLVAEQQQVLAERVVGAVGGRRDGRGDPEDEVTADHHLFDIADRRARGRQQRHEVGRDAGVVGTGDGDEEGLSRRVVRTGGVGRVRLHAPTLPGSPGRT